MKGLVTIVRILVGLLFIFSGLVKANDPLGLSYKMQEYFEVWHTSQFDSHTLLLSILMNAFEIIAGFALLLGWRIKLFIWLLLLLIVFFTFLTGYTYFTGMPKNCGCFGDCLPITSKTSFLKDVALTIMIAFLLWKQHMIRPLFSVKTNTIIMLVVTLFSFGFQWYTLTYMPVVDCLPYKKGNNISEKMKMPANAIPDSTVITFVYEKDGKLIEFTADKFPDDFKTPPYVFKNRYDKIVRKGSNNVPPISGFSLTGTTGVDSTEIILQQPYAVLLFMQGNSIPFTKWKDSFDKIYASAKAKNIPVYILTTNIANTTKQISNTSFKEVPVFTFDFVAFRTAARTDPSVYLLQKGTVLDKWSYKTMDELADELQKLPAQPAPAVPAAVTDSSTVVPVTGNSPAP